MGKHLFSFQNKPIMRIIYLACLFLCCVSYSKSNDPVSQDPNDDTPNAEPNVVVFPGVGHQAVYRLESKDYLFFHAHDRDDNGRSKLLIREIAWDEAGWPSVSL